MRPNARRSKPVANAAIVLPESLPDHRLQDWMRQYRGRSRVVLRPKTAAEVQAIVAHCAGRGIGLVPQGGNTGLVGGSVPIGAEVVVSLERMNAVISFDPASGVLVAEAGCILERLDAHLEPHGYMMPLDLGAKGSCQIGGNVSTNAGGLRYLRYGSLHGSVLGLSAVTGEGVVLDCLSVLRKDNVGYDLKQAFIGAEGTLGIVTAVAIQAVPRPKAVNVALFGLPSFQAAVDLTAAARSNLGEVLSAIEFVDCDTMRITTQQLYGWDLDKGAPVATASASATAAAAAAGSSTPVTCPMPLATPVHPFYVVIETGGSNAVHDAEKLDRFLEVAMGLNTTAATDGGGAVDGVVAADVKQARALWRLREEAAVGVSRRGHVFKYDVSFPLASMYDLVGAMRERLDSRGWRQSHGVITVGYGHLGDGNLHLNVSTPDRGKDYLKDLADDIEPYVFDWTLARGGSISAEHGVGQAKVPWLLRAKSAAHLRYMWAMKAAFDPHRIMNPGKVLPLA